MIQSIDQIPANMNVAYVTINPLDFCAIEYNENNIPVEESLTRWIEIHAVLENDHALRLKNEDILRFDSAVVKRFLEGIEVSFDVNKLWGIQGEIRPYHLDSVPFLKQVWRVFRESPVITKVGYSDTSLEE